MSIPPDVGAFYERVLIFLPSHAVLVDHGLMRLDECAQVKETLGKHLGIDLTVVDASERFMSGLAGVTDPEKKRKFIGNTL